MSTTGGPAGRGGESAAAVGDATEREQPSQPVHGAQPAGTCTHCGAAMAADQEWCLECGSARTLIHRPPDWRVPIAIIAAVVLLVLAAFAIALVNLSGEANRSAQTQAATSPARASPPAPTAATRTPAPRAASVPGWPTGLSGWTVILARRKHKAKAYELATRLARTGIKIGVLNSSKHPSMIPGYWIVFSGRYPTQTAALSAAGRLRAQGLTRARARRVAPPGGI